MGKRVPHRAYRPIRNDIDIFALSFGFPSSCFFKRSDFLERYFFLEQCLYSARDFLDPVDFRGAAGSGGERGQYTLPRCARWTAEGGCPYVIRGYFLSVLESSYFVTTPQAIRSPEFPEGSVFMSSALAWMTIAVPPLVKSE